MRRLGKPRPTQPTLQYVWNRPPASLLVYCFILLCLYQTESSPTTNGDKEGGHDFGTPLITSIPSRSISSSISGTQSISKSIPTLNSNGLPSISTSISETQSASETENAGSVASLSISISQTPSGTLTGSNTRLPISPSISTSASQSKIVNSPSTTVSNSRTTSVSNTEGISASVPILPSTSATLSPSSSISSSPSSSISPSPSISRTNIPSPSASISRSSVASASLSVSPSSSTSASPSSIPSLSMSVSRSSAPSVSTSISSSISGSPSVTLSPTNSLSPSMTGSISVSSSLSSSSSVSPTTSPSPTISTTSSSTPSMTSSMSVSSSITPSHSISSSVSTTSSISVSQTPISSFTTFYVDSNNACNTTLCGFSALCPCGTIAEAIELIDIRSSEPQSLILAPGTYYGEGNTNIVFPQTIGDIYVEPSNTTMINKQIIIECSHGLFNGFIVSNNTVHLQNIKFDTCGTAHGRFSAAIAVSDGGTILAEDLVVYGKARISQANFVCENCLFGMPDPILGEDVIIFDESFMEIDTSYALFTNCTFQNIEVRTIAQKTIVSSMNVQDSSVELVDCNFQENKSDGRSSYASSCIYAGSSGSNIDASISLTNCTFSKNMGSPVVMIENQMASFSSCVFSQHIQGSILVSYGSNITLQDSTFERNTDALYANVMSLSSRNTDPPSIPSTLTVEECLFQLNINLAGNGACIYAESGSVTLSHVSFENNRARKGGAVYIGPQLLEGDIAAAYHGDYGSQSSLEPSSDLATNKTLIVNFCTFNYNTATTSGGAIELEGNVGEVTISNSSFTSNMSPNGRGGALNLLFPNGTAIITRNNFTKNKVSGGIAGAIHLSGDASISFNDFQNNTARLGGCIHMDSGKSQVFGNLFMRNEADYGGALYVTGITTGLSRGNMYSNNYASQNGGGLVASGSSDMNFVNEQFVGNIADAMGGSLSIDSQSTCAFLNISVLYSQTKGSGAVNCMGNSQPHFRGCAILNNTASQEGGGIYIQDNAAPVFILCDISMNNCSTAAGGILVTENAGGIFENCTIRNNMASNNGGGLKASGSAATQFFDCLLEGNSASGDGGGASVEDFTTVGFNRGQIQYNYATSSGGGVAVHGSTTAFFIETEIRHNAALSHGGGCSFHDTSRGNFQSCIIENNVSPINGGGIVAMDLTETAVLNCSISSNLASNGGGIEIISFALPTFQNCQVQNNTASSKGGGIQLSNFCSPTFNNVTIQSNMATNGGGISQSNRATPTFISSFILSNTAKSQAGGLLLEDYSSGEYDTMVVENNIAMSGSGGGVVASDFTNATFIASEFRNNEASISGAGVFISSSSSPFFHACRFTENRMIGKPGGAIVIVGSSFPTFTESVVDSNMAESGAGFWIGNQASPIILSITISNNAANHRGGGIYLQTGANPIINGSSTIFNNTALQGGGLYLESRARGEFQDLLVFDNQAVTDGGGVYLSCSNSLFISSSIKGNMAENGGGGFVESCVLFPEPENFVRTSFTENHATYGGGIFIGTDASSSCGNVATGLQTSTEQLGIDFLAVADDEIFFCTDCTISSNIAEAGGGIYLSSVPNSSFSVTFGPTLTLASNLAHELGGAIFMEPFTIPESVWLSGAIFSTNSATWGASTIGFASVPPNVTSNDITYLCFNCTFESNNEAGTLAVPGYQTSNGFGTPPFAPSFQANQDCPSTIQLVNNSFSVGVILLDAFGSIVEGSIFASETFTFNLTLIDIGTPCNMPYQGSQTITAGGAAIFPDITLEGNNQNFCALQFLPVDFPSIDVLLPVSCQIELEGCPVDQHAVTDETSGFSQCEENTGISRSSTVFLLCLLLLILLCLVLLLCYCLFAVHRRQNRKSDRFVGLLPDFDRSEEVTIFDILNDPLIPVIPWSEIEKRERIGIGGSGIVWRGELRADGGNSRGVALKQLLFGIDNITSKLLTEFLREIKLMSALRHENVVEFIGVSVSDAEQELYLVTELMHNGSLSDLFLKKKFNMPWPLRLRLIQDAACGMAYLHSRNLIHRDLKSQNLLVNDQWVCKIADFGISTIKPAAEKTMTCIGTPVYMAPEVIGSNKYSEKADIFSFAVLLVETYTLNSPYSENEFSEITQAQLMYKICHQGLRPPTTELPLPLVQLVNDCWNENPEYRPSFPEIIIRLHRLETLDANEGKESFPDTAEVPSFSHRNTHTYTTFHEMIAPDRSSLQEGQLLGEDEDSTLSRISINDEENPLL